jgi:catechol 2,3-dioxygenase-like lactoylglutathione lyase family enzyme
MGDLSPRKANHLRNQHLLLMREYKRIGDRRDAIAPTVLLQIKMIAPRVTVEHCRAGFFDRIAGMQADAPSRAFLTVAEPQLFVADIKAACDFFTEKLGFAVEFTYGEPPYYAQVKRDAARLNLRCVKVPVIDPALRDREELLAASLTVATAAEIRQLAAEFEAAGVVFFQALKREPWDALDFIVRDVDGNLLLFAGPSE